MKALFVLCDAARPPDLIRALEHEFVTTKGADSAIKDGAVANDLVNRGRIRPTILTTES
jgi:hypothetical protein